MSEFYYCNNCEWSGDKLEECWSEPWQDKNCWEGCPQCGTRYDDTEYGVEIINIDYVLWLKRKVSELEKKVKNKDKK